MIPTDALKTFTQTTEGCNSLSAMDSSSRVASSAMSLHLFSKVSLNDLEMSPKPV